MYAALLQEVKRIIWRPIRVSTTNGQISVGAPTRYGANEPSSLVRKDYLSIHLASYASRPSSLVIALSMIVAYFTPDFEAVCRIFSDPDKFVKADLFPFLLPNEGDSRARESVKNESGAWSNALAFAGLKHYAAPCLGTGLPSSERPSVECGRYRTKHEYSSRGRLQ